MASEEKETAELIKVFTKLYKDIKSFQRDNPVALKYDLSLVFSRLTNIIEYEKSHLVQMVADGD